MDQEIISKKDLLEKMQISYGQLYRWKRKKLIPEDWFIKKSVSTGQETFFPKDKIIIRINKILELKDDISLDDLANQFSYNVKDIVLKKSYLINYNIVPFSIIERFETVINIDEGKYEQSRLFSLFIYEELIKTGALSSDELNEITLSVFNNYESLSKEELVLVVKRKLGICVYYVISNEAEIALDENLVNVTRICLRETLQKIKYLKLN